jgi:hypothetical protein
MFEPGTYLSLPHRDATNYFVTGHFKSPEEMRLIVGSHTGSQNLSEHQVTGQYWDYSSITSNQNNSYNIDQHLYIHGYGNVKDFESGINAGLMSVGENDYLFLAPYPDLYLYKSVGDSLIPVWYKNNVNTNSILVHDFDKNGISEFYVNDGQKILGFEKDVVMSPRKPNGFQAFPLDTHLVYLKWNPSMGADRYIIYRGTNNDNITKYDSTVTEIMYIDSAVINNQQYFYAIQIIDFAFENERSRLSTILSAIPNQPPFVDTLIVKNMNQIEVHFTESMEIKSLKALNFFIRSEDNPTTSATAFLNGKAVLLSFSNPFLYGETYELALTAIRDTNKTPLPESETIRSFVYLHEVDKKPYVQEWHFEGDKSLILKFNLAMSPNTILDISNYELEPSGRVESVKSVNDSEKIFRLELSNDTYGINSGMTTYLTLHNLESLQGTRLESGNRIALISIASDIDQIVVYPQPVTAEIEWLMFSNIAQGTSIKIFDMNGHYITELAEQDQNGGVQWDLRDQSGSKVSSGIYIYYATFENQTKLGKFTIIK